MSEHIIYGGPTFKLWLKKVCNAIIDLEVVPPSFLKAVIVPIYKGKGKDPLSTNNYRVISLTSVIGKLFERIVLQRMTPGSFGRDGNSTLHTDSISSRNLLLRSNRGGPGSCQKPYTTWINSVPMFLRSGKGIRFCGVYCVLLDHLYRSGINGKTWRLIKSFYINPSGQVKIGNRHSRVFTLERGVRQGSVLSPLLFLLVTDSLLKDLANVSSIEGIYTGSMGHADNLRSVTPNLASLRKQTEMV